MKSLNQHVISGYIGGYLTIPGGELSQSPIVNKFDSGARLVVLSIGSTVNRKVGEEWVKETIWRKIEFWGNDASFLGEYSQKGQHITVSYEEFPSSWLNNDGEKRYGVKCKAIAFDLPKQEPKQMSKSEANYEADELANLPY